jgi:2-C-methyl-D-erythritol 4-phosphate cytidylyltransferase/2-C-methyl-D-erythritol 2,4-cyclodiphosphate synthase
MRFCGILLAAGASERYGQDKVWLPFGEGPVWLASLRALMPGPAEHVVVVVSDARLEEARALLPPGSTAVAGGASRSDSLRRGVEAVPAGFDAALVHDAARPYCSVALAQRVAEATRAHGAAYPSVPVTDTVRYATDTGTQELDRSRVVAAQTPQGSRLDWLREALASGAEATDEAGMLAAVGHAAVPVPGEASNRKLTYGGDLHHERETRTGLGYDVHAFSDDPERPLVLGGVLLPGAPGLQGHSDADAVLHALTDAVLGAVGAGDIGQHFPDTDSQWRGADSAQFLAHAAALASGGGWSIVNVDVTVIAERPRIAQHRDAMRAAIGRCLGIDPGRVGIKATTNEGLGALGRGEGVAALAVATVERPRREA